MNLIIIVVVVILQLIKVRLMTDVKMDRTLLFNSKTLQILIPRRTLLTEIGH